MTTLMFSETDTQGYTANKVGACTVRLQILGPVQMTVHGRSVDIGATKVRGLVGVLAYKSNTLVSTDYLAGALWDDDHPAEPAKTLQVYVSRLRRVINESGFPAEVFHDHGGYRLSIDPSIVDHQRFVALARAGHRALGQGKHGAAADSFGTAIDLWHGPPLSDLRTFWARRLRDSLVTRSLLSAQCALAEAKLAVTEHEFVLDQLPPLLADHPYEYRLAGLWMRALARAGRSGEIPAFFREFSDRLKSDLKAEPSVELTEIYQTSLRVGAADHNLRLTDVRIPRPPRDTRYFTGRADLLSELDNALLGPDRTATVVALDGRPGVGKTELIRHWARLHRDEFPDGTLHMDLAGYAGSGTAPTEPGTVMGMFLDQLGAADTQIPSGLDDRAALLRRTLAGRRVLVVLDNARDSEHVRPLLLAMTSCPIVVTSRQRLTGIAVRDGAERVTVPELSDDDATALLEMVIGRRSAAEPGAVGELVALCEGLPLAVRIVGEHVASRPEVPMGELADELRQARRLLDAGAHGDDDTTLRSAFSWSYRALRPQHGRLFRLLGLFPTTRFSAAAAAAVSGLSPSEADQSIDALVGAHLVEQERAGRYRMHDLLHLYAADRAGRDEPEEQHEQALQRLLSWYVDTARNARRHLTADPNDVPELPATEPVAPFSFDTREEAKNWFDQERASVVALVRNAAALGRDEAVWRMAACMNVVHNHDLRELLEVHELGRASAALAGQRAAEAGCLSSMGVIHGKLGDNVSARECFERAYDVFHDVGDAHGEAVSLHNVGAIHLRLGNPAQAIDFHHKALRAFSAVGNEWAVANVHRWLGDDYRALRQFDRANMEYRDSLHMSRKLDDDQGEGATLNRLTQLALAVGRPEQAVHIGLSGLDVHDRTGDRSSAAEVLCTLATARIELKDYAQAVADATEAVRTHEQMRNTAGRAAALEVLGRAYAAAGEHDHAVDSWSMAADLLESLDDSRAKELRELASQPAEQRIPVPRPDLGTSARPTVNWI